MRKVEYECDMCKKTILVEMDSSSPINWGDFVLRKEGTGEIGGELCPKCTNKILKMVKIKWPDIKPEIEIDYEEDDYE